MSANRLPNVILPWIWCGAPPDFYCPSSFHLQIIRKMVKVATLSQHLSFPPVTSERDGWNMNIWLRKPWGDSNCTVIMSVWHLLDPCWCDLSVWKQVIEKIFHRLQGRLEKESQNYWQCETQIHHSQQCPHRDGSPASQVEKKWSVRVIVDVMSRDWHTDKVHKVLRLLCNSGYVTLAYGSIYTKQSVFL